MVITISVYYSVLVQYRFFRSVPVSVLKPRFLRFCGPGSGTSDLVPTSRYQGFGTKFSKGLFAFVSFWYILVRFHFASISASKQVEPKALVLEPKTHWSLNCRKSSVPIYRSCSTFGILGFRLTLVLCGYFITLSLS